MITVAAVEHGDYQKRGSEYVRKLKAAVHRNMTAAHRFVCLTDDPRRHPGIECQMLPSREKDGLSGWWAKCYLFSPDRFEGRVLYLDLDSLITGPLDALTQTKGIIHLIEWGWARNCYGSGVMLWDAGEHREIWDRYTPEVPHCFEGDQMWLHKLGGWDALPKPPTLCSYRYHCKQGVPEGCVVASMHGPDKPHLLPEDHWTRRYWH